MSLIPYAVTIVAGVMNAVHSGTNAELTRVLERPWWAAVIVSVVSGLVLVVAVAFSRETMPSGSALAATPWWAWVGTAIAAVPIITTLLFAGRLGGATFNGLVVTSTIMTSVLLDHFGLLGFEVHLLTLWRALGALLMIAGLTLVCLF